MIHQIKTKFIYSIFIRRIFNIYYRHFNAHPLERKILANFKNCFKENLISFGFANLHFFEHIKDFYFYLKNNNQSVSIISPTINPSNKRKEEFFNYFVNVLKLEIGEDIIPFPYSCYLNSKHYLECSISTYHIEMRNTKKFLYTHGLDGLNFAKDYKAIKYVRFYDFLLLNGPMQKKALEIAANFYNIRLPEMYEVGYLRGDRLWKLSKNFDKQSFQKRLGLKPNIPVILYAPTWGYFSSTKEWIDVVVSITRNLSVYLLIKLHPFMMTERSKFITGGINWAEKLRSLKEKFNHVRVIEEQNLDDYMLASDVMISDVSGLALEFMVLEKPAIFLPAPEYFKLYGEQRPIKWCRPNYEIKNVKALEIEIKKAINGKGYIYPSDKLVYNKGFALEKLKEIISV